MTNENKNQDESEDEKAAPEVRFKTPPKGYQRPMMQVDHVYRMSYVDSDHVIFRDAEASE